MPKAPTPKTPGAALEKFIKDFNLPISGLALELGQNTTTFKKLLDGSKRITVEIALLLAKKFGTTADYWIDLQKKAALAEAKADEKLQQRLKEIKKAVIPPKGAASTVAAGKKPDRKQGRPVSDTAKKPGRKPGRKPLAPNGSAPFSVDDSDSDS
jgi:addiction module HigA family antidote